MAKRVLTIIEINNFFNFVKFKPREASNNLGFIGPDSSQKEHPVLTYALAKFGGVCFWIFKIFLFID